MTMAKQEIQESGPNWVWYVVGIGGAAPIVLLIIMAVFRPSSDTQRVDPAGEEQRLREEDDAREEVAARDREEAAEKNRRERRMKKIKDLRASAAGTLGLQCGLVGLLVGVINFLAGARTVTRDVYTGKKIGGQKVTQEQTWTELSDEGYFWVIVPPVAGFVIGLVGGYLFSTLLVWLAWLGFKVG
jgi:hypothetical protein